jgi:Inositolphosphorylceramide synthase subunit Kei1
LVVYSYFFVVDFVINILYTILFASIWFLIVADSDQTPPIGSKTFDSVTEAAGFVDPLFTGVTRVHVVATSNANPLTGQHGSLVGVTGPPGDSGEGSTLSTISIAFFWLVKFYFIIIVFSYAQSVVVRTHISAASFPANGNLWTKVQRWMLSGTYWRDDDDDEYKPVRVVP